RGRRSTRLRDLRKAMRFPFNHGPDKRSKNDRRTIPKMIPARAACPRAQRRNRLWPPFKIVQIPGLTLILNESRTTFRQIFTDGRPLPKLIDWPAWQGFSIGKWEGDRLVVATAGTTGTFWLHQAGHQATESFPRRQQLRRR